MCPITDCKLNETKEAIAAIVAASPVLDEGEHGNMNILRGSGTIDLRNF